MYKFILFFMLLLTSMSFPDYYIDQRAGSNQNNGTSTSSPFKDFTPFSSIDLSNITIHVAQGTYTAINNSNKTQILFISSASNLTITKWDRYSGEEVIFDGNYNGIQLDPCNFDSPIITNYSNYSRYGIFIEPTSSSVSNIRIQGIHFQNFYENAIKIRGAYGNISIVNVSGCKITDIIGWRGAANYCTLNVSDNYGTSCAAIHSDNTNSLTISNCTINLIYPPEGRAAQTDGIFMDHNTNTTINNNEITITNNFSTNYLGQPASNQAPHVDCIQLESCADSKILMNKVSNLSILNSSFAYPYANRQGVFVEGVTGSVHINNNIIQSAQGDGLINLHINPSDNLIIAQVYNNTVVGLGAQQLLATFTASSNQNKFRVKNNIFYKSLNLSGAITIKFEDFVPNTLSSNVLGYNLHFINAPTIIPQLSFPNTTVPFSTYDLNGINIDPQFQNIGVSNYNLVYGSPAKNAGIGLLNDGVATDNVNNPRPYWDEDFDIGAYEVQGDAQLKLGIYGTPPAHPYFTLSSPGTFWERNSNGAFSISQNSAYVSSVCTVSVANTDKNTWHGWALGWLNPNAPNQNNSFAQGLYKLYYNEDPTKYFYIDYRDAITNYNPNIYIRYNAELQKFQNNTGGDNWSDIGNGVVLRIWTINNSDVSNTAGLTDYWLHTLVCVNKDNHPYLIFGPYTDPSNVLYYEIQKILDINANPWEDFATAGSSLTYQDCNESLLLGRWTHSVAYRIAAHLEALPPHYSNPVSDSLAIIVNGPPLKQKGTGNNNSKLVDYSLNQNYPNPFNPSTCIRYSIKQQGLVKLQVYNVLGSEVETLVNEEKSAGNYEVNFNGQNLSSGVYFYKLTSGTYSEIRKMQFIK